MRSTGIDVLGKIPWGTHLCQFYRTPQDLVEILVPYFREGLESNEFCMWITSKPLLRDQARKALAAEVPDLEERTSKGQIEILDYRDWYISTGTFDADRVLRGWVAKHDGAIARGFEGLRLTGNTFWLEMSDWNKFSDYEERINDVIGQYRILALCTYCLDRCGAPEVIDVVNHHQSALVKNEARWVLIESKQQKQLGLALQEHGHRLRFALEAAQLGEWDLDLVTHAAHRSLRHDQIFGYDRLLPEWTYEMFLGHVLPEDRPLVEEGFRKAMDTGQNWEFECRIIRRDGVRRWIWAKGGVSFDAAGRPSRLRGVVQDITRMKQAEEALRRSRDELELRVKERTLELSQTVELLRDEVARRTHAEQDLRERSDQLRALASDLTLAEQRERRKLAQVLHDSLQQLLVGVKYRLKILQRTKGKDLQNIAAEMDGLVSKSIDVSRLLTFELSPPILYDGGLVQGLEWLASWMKDKYGLEVDLEAHETPVPRQEAVTLLLFQATRELLFNTLKHSGIKAARIRVSCRNDWIEIQVSDRGKGFRPDRALEGRSVSRGFGLFSIQERLALMGGRLEIESSPGQGCRIVLAAPLGGNPEDRKSAHRSPGESPSPHKKVLTGNLAGGPERIRVILADDHAVVRKGLAQLLKNEPDIDVVSEASDGASAVKLARELRPDVVVMDIGMPGMDGIEATKVLHRELPGVRVIGLSIYEENERGEAMRQAGAAAYLTKSGPPEDLIETIRSCARSLGKIKGGASARRGIPAKRPGRRRRK